MKKIFRIEAIISNVENAAFEGRVMEETAAILQKLANDLMNGRQPTILFDVNGNKVGEFTVWMKEE